jgi:hypothetical protein
LSCASLIRARSGGIVVAVGATTQVYIVVEERAQARLFSADVRQIPIVRPSLWAVFGHPADRKPLRPSHRDQFIPARQHHGRSVSFGHAEAAGVGGMACHPLERAGSRIYGLCVRTGYPALIGLTQFHGEFRDLVNA